MNLQASQVAMGQRPGIHPLAMQINGGLIHEGGCGLLQSRGAVQNSSISKGYATQKLQSIIRGYTIIGFELTKNLGSVT